MYENEDTVPMPVIEDTPPWALPVNRDDEEPEVEVIEKPKLPEPALARGAITSVLGIVSILIGREIDPAIVEYLLTLYVTVGPIALAWWIRRNVSPVQK